MNYLKTGFTVAAVMTAVISPMVTSVAFTQVAPIHHMQLDQVAIAAAQQCVNWCWAAGAEMLIRSQRVKVSQADLVRKVYGPSAPCLPTFGRFEPIVRAITGTYETVDGDTISLTAAWNPGAPTNPAGMIQSIDEGRPFLFAYAGHAYVCYGLKWQEYPRLRVVELDLIDPFWVFGSRKLTTFNVFRDDLKRINGTLELLVID